MRFEEEMNLLPCHLSKRIAELLHARRVLSDLDEKRGKGLVVDGAVLLDERIVDAINLIVLEEKESAWYGTLWESGPYRVRDAERGESSGKLLDVEDVGPF